MLYFIIWFLVSLGAAYFLFKRIRLFRKKIGILIAFLAALAAAIIHNLFFFWLKRGEPVFSFISFLALGVGFFLLAVWLVELLGNIIYSKKSREN